MASKSASAIQTSSLLFPHTIKLFGAMALFYSAEMLNAANSLYVYNKFSARKRVVEEERADTPHAFLKPIIALANQMMDNQNESKRFEELASRHDHIYNEIAAGKVFKNLHKYEAALLKKPTRDTVHAIFGDVWGQILAETEIKKVTTSMFLFIPNEEGTGGDIADFLSDVKVTLKRKKVDSQFIWDMFPTTAAASEYLVQALIAYARMARGERGEYEKFASNIHKFLLGLREDLTLNEEKLSKVPEIAKLSQAIVQKNIELTKREVELTKFRDSSNMTVDEAKKADAIGDKFWAEVIRLWNAQIDKEYNTTREEADVLSRTGDDTKRHNYTFGVFNKRKFEAVKIKSPGQISFNAESGQLNVVISDKKSVSIGDEPWYASKMADFEGLVFQLKAKYGLRNVPPLPSPTAQVTIQKREVIRNEKADIQAMEKAGIKALEHQITEIKKGLERTHLTKIERRYDTLVVALFNSVLSDVSQFMSEKRDKKGAESIETLKLSPNGNNRLAKTTQAVKAADATYLQATHKNGAAIPA